MRSLADVTVVLWNYLRVYARCMYTPLTVAFTPALSSMLGGSLGSGGPADFHPRRNILGFVDLALLRATAPAGKDCAGVDLSHASL